MRLFLLVTVLSLVGLALAWTPEDHEIFRLRDELTTLEGQDVSFYEFLGVAPSASLDEINRQYRKKSRQLHPDKAIPSLLAQRSTPKLSKDKTKSKKKPGVTVTKGPTAKERAQVSKEANERYAHLGIVASILRGAQRERYDHFLRNGFPRWRGTGYYYARLRPGLGSVMVGLLIVFGGAAHYGALYIGWKRQREFVQRYVTHARNAAWGNESGIPGVPGMAAGAPPVPAQALQQDDNEGAMPLNRRQKRMQEKESKKKDNSRLARTARVNGISTPTEPELISGPQGTKKKVVAPNGKVLIVDSVGNVYLEETSEEGETNEFLLDPEEIPKPTMYQTALFRLPIWLYSQSLGRAVDHFRGTSENAEEPLFDEDGRTALESAVGQHDDEMLDSATANTVQGELKKRRAKPRGL